uniref:Uncharacterized protein n=1 Tax=Romanomermis culicivorax TaxID=13658 RepID=A0A915L3Z3_ROMCU
MITNQYDELRNCVPFATVGEPGATAGAAALDSTPPSFDTVPAKRFVSLVAMSAAAAVLRNRSFDSAGDVVAGGVGVDFGRESAAFLTMENSQLTGYSDALFSNVLWPSDIAFSVLLPGLVAAAVAASVGFVVLSGAKLESSVTPLVVAAVVL